MMRWGGTISPGSSAFWQGCGVLALLAPALALASPPAQARALAPSDAQALVRTPGAPWRGKIESRLLQLYDAGQRGGLQAARRFARQHGLTLAADGRVRVELRSADPAEWRDPRWLQALGGQWAVAGSDRADALVPLSRLAEVARRPALTWLQIPLAPLRFSVHSQGVALAGLQPYHCQSWVGLGAKIAVVDMGFAGWGAAAQAGELPADVPTPADGGYPHGTQCAEVAVDVAPGAKIEPVEVHSVAALQAWVSAALSDQTPRIVSHSLGWFGESFGDGSGWLCQAAAQLRGQGGVWVTAAGNLGSGSVWRGPWTDADGDGWLEFAPGDSQNRFGGAASSLVLAVLDWDDYPLTGIDLDLQLCRVSAGGCEVVAEAKAQQSGSQPPVETLSFALTQDATYAWRVRKNGAAVPKELRLSVVSPAQGPLQFYSTDKTLAYPADCEAAVAVAALPALDYASGPVAAYSSRGPTSDGRAKPDLAGPTAVITSQTASFQGTSAACPHVAAAIAVQAQVAGVSPAEAASAVIAAAQPLPGAPSPDFASGKGRLYLGFAGAGAACQPGAELKCQGSCGASGVQTCSTSCQLSACTLPKETCNGQDDDCDGQSDEGFACSGAAVLPCDTSCGTKGTRSCDATCAWAVCKAPAEACNGVDDDCDGQSDEDFACALGSAEPCTTAAGHSGTLACNASCSAAECIPDERCNGQDDDGDGQIDEGLSCPRAESGWCNAGRGPGRGGSAYLALILMNLGVFVWRRRPRGSSLPLRSGGQFL